MRVYVCVCVCVCVCMCLFVLGWVKFRAQIPSIIYHTLLKHTNIELQMLKCIIAYNLNFKCVVDLVNMQFKILNLATLLLLDMPCIR